MFSYESNQSKLRAAASSEALSFDSGPSHLSSGSLISLNSGDYNSGRVARWAVSLEAVLSDSLGKMAFSYFLKLEFSEENLQFWVDCDKYHSCPLQDRAKLADRIIRKYIGQDAEMTVNLPSHLEASAMESRERFATERIPPNFATQQRHIHDLMKFDSYPRFIRSEHYRKLVQMNISNKTVTEEDISRAFQRRPDSRVDEKKGTKKSAFQILRNAVHIPSSVRKERRLSSDGILMWESKNVPSTSVSAEPKCYVHFNDGRNIAVRLHSHMTVHELLEDIAKRFDIGMSNVDWLLVGENRERPLVMEENCGMLRDKHIRAEIRVTFRLDITMLSRRIAIRSKTHKPIIDVLRPIVEKYLPEVDVTDVSVRIDNSGGKARYVNLQDPVLTVNNTELTLEFNNPQN